MHSVELRGEGARGRGGCSTRRGLLKVCEALSLKLNLLVSFRSLGCLGVINSSSAIFSGDWKERPQDQASAVSRWWCRMGSGEKSCPGIGWKWERVIMPEVLAPEVS